MEQQSIITNATIEQGMSYEAYRQLIDELYTAGRATGDFMDNSPEILEYVKMNISRMRRGDKTCKINDALKTALEGIQEKWVWLVLTEGWCGDAAQSIPAIAKMAELSPNIELKFILRDANLAIMDAYLTNGGRSIPKLVALKADTLEELGNWGPRPIPAQAIIEEHKAAGIKDYKAYAPKVHEWYAADRYRTIQAEFLALIEAWK